MPAKKAAKRGRPSLPKSEVLGKPTPIRFQDAELKSFEKAAKRRPTRSERKIQRVTRVMRGQTLDEVLKIEATEAAEDAAKEPTIEDQLGL